MSKIKTFKDLKVWQIASELSNAISRELVSILPKHEKYKLCDQIVRSSRSVASQISEGFRKSSLKEKHHYYEMATTSNDETENHLIEIRNNDYIDEKVLKKYENRVIRIRILLSRLMRSIRSLQTKHDKRR